MEFDKSNEITSSMTEKAKIKTDSQTGFIEAGRLGYMAGQAEKQHSLNKATKPDEQLTKFIYFSKLPIEIRCKIWKCSCFQEPRNIGLSVIDLSIQGRQWKIRNDRDIYQQNVYQQNVYQQNVYQQNVYQQNVYQQNIFNYKTISPRPHPAVLHTSKESRTEALRHYKLEFGVEQRVNQTKSIFNSPPTTYVNWQNDTLVIVDPRAFRNPISIPFKDFVRRCIQNKAKFIAFNATGFGGASRKYDVAMTDMLQCSINLHEINLFSADIGSLINGHLRKQGTKLGFEVIPLPFKEASYKNGGDALWKKEGITKDLENAEKSLRESFQRHKDQLRKKNSDNDDEGEKRALAWKQPTVIHSKIHLNLLNGSDNRPGVSESGLVVLED